MAGCHWESVAEDKPLDCLFAAGDTLIIVWVYITYTDIQGITNKYEVRPCEDEALDCQRGGTRQGMEGACLAMYDLASATLLDRKCWVGCGLSCFLCCIYIMEKWICEMEKAFFCSCCYELRSGLWHNVEDAKMMVTNYSKLCGICGKINAHSSQNYGSNTYRVHL